MVKTILIAEDDLPSRELLAEILASWGYGVVHAANGIEALEQITATRPDLVLLDIQMPLLDGFGVIERLRADERFRSLPVVALTAYAMREDRQRTADAGFDAHLSKPLELEMLRALVAARFSKTSESRENTAGSEVVLAVAARSEHEPEHESEHESDPVQ